MLERLRSDEGVGVKCRRNGRSLETVQLVVGGPTSFRLQGSEVDRRVNGCDNGSGARYGNLKGYTCRRSTPAGAVDWPNAR